MSSIVCPGNLTACVFPQKVSRFGISKHGRNQFHALCIMKFKSAPSFSAGYKVLLFLLYRIDHYTTEM